MAVEKDKRKTHIVDRRGGVLVFEFVSLQGAVYRYFFRGPDDGIIVRGVAKLKLKSRRADFASGVKRDAVYAVFPELYGVLIGLHLSLYAELPIRFVLLIERRYYLSLIHI